MKNVFNLNFRDKGLDEIVGMRNKDRKIPMKYNRRKNRGFIPEWPVFNTFEEALCYPMRGWIYAVRVSIPFYGIADLNFPVWYVKIPYQDFSAVRKSYNNSLKYFYTDLQLLNRKISHIDSTGNYYQRDIVANCLGNDF